MSMWRVAVTPVIKGRVAESDHADRGSPAEIDMTIDGLDKVDPQQNLVKGLPRASDAEAPGRKAAGVAHVGL